VRAGARRPTRAEAGPSAAGRVRLKGRHLVALWLLAFLLVSLAVIKRQSAALETSRDLQQLRRTRGALEVSRSALVDDIHRSRSRAVLVPLAQQKLGLRLPQDSEITILQEPRPR
jgi:hypothetical protein